MAFVHLFQNKLWKTELLQANEEIIITEFNTSNGLNGYAVIKKKKLNFLPFYFLRITFGPVIDYSKPDQIEKMLGELKVIAKQHKALYVEFNPFVWDMDLKAFEKIAGTNGFKPAKDHIYRNSILIDLSLTEDEIFKQFERRGQKAIRQSVDRGIVVKLVDLNSDNFDRLYKLYKNTCSRTSFIPEDETAMKTQMLFWGDKKECFLFFAYSDSKVVGALLLFNNKDSVSTFYQGNDYDPDIMNKRPSNAMYWESLKWAKTNGFKYYDLGGITVDNAAGDEKKEGIHNFKTQFGGRVISLPGNYSYVNKPLSNFLINSIMPIYSKITLRRARSKQFGSN